MGLDPASRQQLLSAVHELAHRQNVAVLWATHLVEEIKVADRLILLNGGQIRFAGSLEDFMARAPGQDLQEEVLKQLSSHAKTPALEAQ